MVSGGVQDLLALDITKAGRAAAVIAACVISSNECQSPALCLTFG